jgi:SAM-dependent methyltransferase
MAWRLQRLARPAWLGTLRRTRPLSNECGADRGTPVDRYYIQHFLESHRQDIHGRVLEMQDSSYTDRYGVGVERRDVLDVDPQSSQATIVADLAAADVIGSDLFDCYILTQTLQYIYNLRATITHIHRILRPGGVVLVTVPSVSRIDHGPHGVWPDHWRFTVDSCSLLFGEVFGADQVTVRSYGNVLSAIAFLMGMAYEELSREELDVNDEIFPLIIAIRATKPRVKRGGNP